MSDRHVATPGYRPPSSFARRVAWLAIISSIQAACADPADRSFDVQDVATFVVADSPDVSIGAVGGDERYLLHNVSDATLQSDGSIVVLNCGAADVRYFDADGEHIRTIGRRGDGPGEYQIPQRLFRLGGDTIAIYDLLGGRVTTLGPEGSVEGAVQAGSMLDGLSVIGRLGDGSFVGRRYDRDSSMAPATAYRRSVSLLLLDAEGQPTDSLVGLPAMDVMSPERPRGPTLALRLARAAVFAVHPDGVYYGAQDSTGIVKFGASLEPTAVISPITRPAPVTDQVREADRAMRDDRAHMPPDGIVGATVDAYPPEMPSFGDLVDGRDGRLWVEDPVRPGLHPLTWTAYEDGVAVARLELPPRFFPFEFGRDWVLGASYDEMTITRVELRRLVSSPLPEARLPPRDAMPPAQPRCSGWASR